MSQSYKERCLTTDDAIAMWSFDGDSYDPGSYLPFLDYLIDEVDNTNPARILHDSPNIPSMTIGRPSLVELESSNQYSAIFGAGTAQNIPGYWPKTYLSVNHSATFSFLNRGSFSVEFLWKKTNEDVWGASYASPAYWQKYSPVIRKAGVFTVYTHWGYTGEWVTVSGPLASWNINRTECNYETKIAHTVLTWEVKKIAEFEYTATQCLYLNNRLFKKESQNYFDNTYPNTNVTNPIEIGGFSSGIGGTQGDRNASRLYIDQISIYDRALSHNEVSAHYKKIFSYRNMIINESPESFWDMADEEVYGNSAIKVDVGTIDGVLYGGYLRNVEGPDQLPTTGAVQFSPTGHCRFPKTDYYGQMSPFRNISGDYTFEFWFKSGCNDPCVILTMRGYSTNFDGWLLELNKFDKSLSPGALQFTERRGVQCKALGSWNDFKWHHVAVRRLGSTINLYVDGIVVSSVVAGVSSLSAPGQLAIFSDGPDTFAGPGAMCYLAIYNYALQDAQIECRSTYNVGYEIKGVVTLMGNPVAATLRFYKSNTGELIDEIDSDPVTGEYRKELFNNGNIDIMVFDKYNKNVRYRAYGPVAPAGFDDYPIII